MDWHNININSVFFPVLVEHANGSIIGKEKSTYIIRRHKGGTRDEDTISYHYIKPNQVIWFGFFAHIEENPWMHCGASRGKVSWYKGDGNKVSEES